MIFLDGDKYNDREDRKTGNGLEMSLDASYRSAKVKKKPTQNSFFRQSWQIWSSTEKICLCSSVCTLKTNVEQRHSFSNKLPFACAPYLTRNVLQCIDLSWRKHNFSIAASYGMNSEKIGVSCGDSANCVWLAKLTFTQVMQNDKKERPHSVSWQNIILVMSNYDSAKVGHVPSCKPREMLSLCCCLDKNSFMKTRPNVVCVRVVGYPLTLPQKTQSSISIHMYCFEHLSPYFWNMYH